MLANVATRQQVADVIGVGVKTVYKYFPAQGDDKKSPRAGTPWGKTRSTLLLCARLCAQLML